MVNIEKNNQEHRTTKPRKIEVYRKTLTEPTEPGIQSEEDETEKPKIINKEDKIFFINLGLMVSFIVFFLVIFISSSLFSNPFHSTSNINKEQDSTSNNHDKTYVFVVSDPSVPSDKTETMFFDKDGKIKIFNVIIAAGAGFLTISAYRSFMER